MCEEEKRKAAERGSYGLLSMEERVMACGGTIVFDSAPGKGTTVTLRIPLRKGDDDGK
jgi:two-component system sensor histidine kinase DegS